MNNIVAEIVELLKDGTDTIERETNLHRYIGKVICGFIAEALVLLDDGLWLEYKKQGAGSERKDCRTLITAYGEVELRRRLVRLPNGRTVYPLDEAMGFGKRERFSPYLQYVIAGIATKCTYRDTAAAVGALTNVTISHTQVGTILKRVGQAYTQWEDARLSVEVPTEEKLKKPAVLRIEGDAVEISGKGKKRIEIHRFQIAEGVETHGNRHSLIGTYCVAATQHAKAVEKMQSYIEQHYDLSQTLVLSNSDGGPGYGKDVFDTMLGMTGRHEHFRDAYHVNKKCKERLNFVPKELSRQFQRSLWQHDKAKVTTQLDTMESLAEDDCQVEQLKRLRAYLDRNWEYLVPVKMRGITEELKGLGTCESNHRPFSFRMKRQGKSWGVEGAEAIANIISGLRNGDLTQALSAQNPQFAKKADKTYKNAVRNALKKSKAIPHIGAHAGSIWTECPTSSAIGQLAKFINFGGMIA